MSRFLSAALGANEAKFRHAVMALERRSGHPNHDIHLTSAIMQKVPLKLKELGLDPVDTTSEELYYALNRKLEEQDQVLVKEVRKHAASKINAEANIIDGLKDIVNSQVETQKCFAIKQSVIKAQLKQAPPKKVMKALKYRSIDSMLKLEPVPLMLLAVNTFESEAYITSFYTKYKKYSPSNFELRPLAIIIPKDKKWQRILQDIKDRTGLSVVSSYELASVILLPISNQPQIGICSLTLTSLLKEVSTVISASSYLKLHQVSPDFGHKLQSIVESEPSLDINILNHKLSWQSAQSILKANKGSVFAPHLSPDELEPANLLSRLGDIAKELAFWDGCDNLALVRSAKATSLNIMDVATNVANKLPFNDRQLDHLRHSLGQEIAKLYTSPTKVSESINGDSLASNQRQVVESYA
ncbi:MAG: hypothetical protein ACYCPS_00245 [Candidatus Saccharimonadales bacterium]